MAKDAKTIREELARPFAPEDLEWRIQVTSKDKTSGLAIPYVTNRAIQDRLDEVVGPENWYNDYKPWHGNGKKDAQICGISIYFEDAYISIFDISFYRLLAVKLTEKYHHFCWIILLDNILDILFLSYAAPNRTQHAILLLLLIHIS